jgi:PAS domain S-box-containing protein
MSPGSLRSLPRTATLGLGLILLLLLINPVVSEWNLRRLVENGHRVVRTQEVLTTLEEVLARVTEAETAERGFLITGEPHYLKPYKSAVAQTFQTLRRLSELMADDPDQGARVGLLKEKVKTRLEELGQAIEARHAGGFDAARQAVSTNHGRRLMNEMRKLVGEMQRKEQRSLAARAAESARSARTTSFSVWAGSALGVGLVGLAFYLYRRDLAHRLRAEDAMRRLADIVQSSDDAIISKTLEGTVVSWNPGAEKVYGYSAADMLGQSIARVFPPEQAGEMRRDLEQVARGHPVEHFEAARMRKDGRNIVVSLRISPLRGLRGEVIGASAIARDVTEHRALQREVLEIAAREQQRIGQDLHDGIGQELTGVAMLAHGLAGELAAKSLPGAPAAEKIVDRLEQALRHVRALSKGLVPVEVDAEGLMVALAELADRTGELNDITCTFHCDEPVRIADNVTATHLYRMTQEALTNALKHGRARHIAIRLEQEAGRTTLQIVDDGVGFLASGEEATGSGLRIMRYRAELIGAKLTIGPVSPTGTRVSCTLAQPAPAELSVGAAAARGPGGLGPSESQG